MSQIDNSQNIIRKFDPLIKDLTHNELMVLNRMIVERIKMIRKANTLLSMSQFHVGDRVSFTDNNGNNVIGIVTRINQKSISLKSSDSLHWKVSPEFLTRIT